jgi:hypothetical protein
MSRRIAYLPQLLMLVLASSPILAADTPLDAVSSDASVVVRLKNPKATVDKVADLADLVVKNAGDQIRNQSAALGLAISNPTLAGVDMESDWWLAVYASGGESQPDVVFIVPATDLAAMKEALGESVKFMESGKLGVYTTDAEAATKTAARLKGEGKSISTLIDKPSSTLFESGDISVFINVAQLAVAYKSNIDEAKDKFTETLENAPNAVPGSAPGIDPKQVTEIVGQILGVLTQGLNDTQSCTIAATVSKEGLYFEDLVRVKSGTPTDKLLAKSAPGPLAALSVLPGGSLLYFGLDWDMADFTRISQWLMGVGAIKPEAAKDFESTLKEIEKLKLESVVTAFGLGDLEGGAVRSVTVTEVDNPAKMREISQKLMKAMGTVENQGVKQTFTVKPDAEKYGKNSADLVTVKTEFDDAQNPLANLMERVQTGMFGPDGMITRAVYLKDRVVQTLGGGKQAMTDVLAALDKKSGDSSKSPVQQTRGKLGAKSNLLILFDVSNTVAKVLSIVVESQVLPPVFPIDADAVKELQSKASYLGISAATEGQGLRVKTHVPVEQMQGIARIVQFFQKVAGGAGVEETEEN